MRPVVLDECHKSGGRFFEQLLFLTPNNCGGVENRLGLKPGRNRWDRTAPTSRCLVQNREGWQVSKAERFCMAQRDFLCGFFRLRRKHCGNSCLRLSAEKLVRQFLLLPRLEVLLVQRREWTFLDPVMFETRLGVAQRQGIEEGLDMSGLTTLTELFSYRQPIESLPASLVEYHAIVKTALTRRTRLG